MPEPRVKRDPASYRDPSGFIFHRDGVVYRQVQTAFAEDWHAFRASGLAEQLTAGGLLIPYESVGAEAAAAPGAVDVVRPEPIPFLSFPYEWSFSQLKDAALLTLRAQELALERGMTIKDASAFNVQWLGSRPILIDTLSFERHEEGSPWIAYRQFCEHFLGPLALIAYRDARLALLLRDLPDGIPVDLATRILPTRTRLNPGLASHLHLHAGAQRRATRAPAGAEGHPRRLPRMGNFQLRALIDGLRRTVEGMRWEPATTWSDYAQATSYSEEGAQAKRRIVAEMLAGAGEGWVWDIGANTGDFSAIAASGGRRVLALDADAGATELHYRRLREAASSAVLPIVADLLSPSPNLGWDLAERPSLLDRANAEVVLALALVHHLAIGGNVPLGHIAELFARVGRTVIVEFVPKEDPQVQRMLSTRRDVFPDYSLTGFHAAVASRFHIAAQETIPGTVRTLIRLARA